VRTIHASFATTASASRRDVPRALDVDQPGAFGIGLGSVNVGPGCSMQDKIPRGQIRRGRLGDIPLPARKRED
jgi:hypothetical protein